MAQACLSPLPGNRVPCTIVFSANGCYADHATPVRISNTDARALVDPTSAARQKGHLLLCPPALLHIYFLLPPPTHTHKEVLSSCCFILQYSHGIVDQECLYPNSVLVVAANVPKISLEMHSGCQPFTFLHYSSGLSVILTHGRTDQCELS